MKKFVACLLTLILCVLIAIPANAEVGFTGDISEQPAPELVPLDETDSVGVFQDEAGEEIGKITEEDLVITTVKEAEAAEEPSEEEAALLNAYEKLSDKDMLLSTQAPSMNAVAAELLGKDHTADDFVVSDLFGVSVRGEENQKTMKDEGNTLALTFQVDVSQDAVITAMAYTDEGWKPVELKNNGDGTVTCTLESFCPVALLLPKGQSNNGGSDSSSDGVPQGNNGTAGNAAHGAFVPSIGAKEAPELVVADDGSVGGMVDSDGNLLSIVQPGCLVVTPVSEAETSTAIAPEDAKLLLEVYDRLCLPDTKLSAEAPAMNEVAEKLLGKGHNADDLVIRDLFDMSFICEEHRDFLPKEGVNLDLKFDLRIDADAVITAMAYVDGEWMPVETVNNGDGTVTCHFKALCPVAFLTSSDGSSAPSGDNGDGPVPSEPGNEPGSDAAEQEPENSNIVLWSVLGAVAAVALALLVFFLLRRKKKAKV